MNKNTRHILMCLLLPWVVSCGDGATPANPPSPNLAPTVLLSVGPVEGSFPLQVNIEVGCFDPEGRVAGFDLDADGDGHFEVQAPDPIHQQLALLQSVNVAARCTDDEGLLSDPLTVSVTVAPPDRAPVAPSDISVRRVSVGHVELSWTDASDNEVGFRIEQRVQGTGDWEELASVEADVASYSDTGLHSVHANLYRVRACNPAGCSDFSTQTNPATERAPAGAPNAPTNLSATAVSTSQIDLSWNDNSTDEAAFLIYRFWGGSGSWEQIALLGPNTTDFSDTGLEAGRAHYYLVLACTVSVCSDISNMASTLTLGTPPPVAAPTGFSATVASPTQIDLTWTDNSENEVSFVIHRSPDGVSDWVTIANLGPNTTFYSDTDLTEGVWYYLMRACSYETCSDYTDVVSTGTIPPPNAPSGLQATGVSATQVDLVWTDNSDDEIGFSIQRSLDGVSGWTQIGQLGTNATGYSDTSGVPGTRYYYSVQSCRFDACSDPSNIDDAVFEGPSGAIVITMGPNAEETVTAGQTLATPVLVDMSAAGGLDVASMSVEVTWDPTKLSYDSHATGTFGTGVADVADVASGTFRYNLTSSTGTQASFTAFTVSLTAATFSGSTTVGVDVTALATEFGSDITGTVTERGLFVSQAGETTPEFDIELEYVGKVHRRYRSAFEDAVTRWEQVIVGDALDYTGFLPANGCQPQDESGPVDDLKIFVVVEEMDGPGGVGGQAYPCYYRTSGPPLPITGIIRLDAADIRTIVNQGLLADVVLHEMGHAIGIGHLWNQPPFAYLEDAGTSDPYFSGPQAIAAFDALGGAGRVGPKVPVENTGAFGTRDAHWRESVFGPELMSGYLNEPGTNTLSLITVASLGDVGYTVNAAAADPFTLPFPDAAAPEASAHPGFRLVEPAAPRPLPAPGGG